MDLLRGPQALRRVEEASLNAWPALQEILLDGWLLRFSEGYTKRANSVNPLYPGILDLEAKIDLCEAHYAARGQPVIFRVTPFADYGDAAHPYGAAHPQRAGDGAGLDACLDERGYRMIDPTRVLAIDLALAEREASGTSSDSVELRSRSLEAWEQIYERFAGKALPPAHRPMVSSIQARGALQLNLASLEHNGSTVACGMGVVEGPYLGIFSVITDPALRRRGYGRALMAALLAWGRTQGAAYAYLQVQEDNGPARALYAGLGFGALYRYWYRVKDA